MSAVKTRRKPDALSVTKDQLRQHLEAALSVADVLAGLTGNSTVKLAVNVVRQLVEKTDFLDLLVAVLGDSGLKAGSNGFAVPWNIILPILIDVLQKWLAGK